MKHKEIPKTAEELEAFFLEVMQETEPMLNSVWFGRLGYAMFDNLLQSGVNTFLGGYALPEDIIMTNSKISAEKLLDGIYTPEGFQGRDTDLDDGIYKVAERGHWFKIWVKDKYVHKFEYLSKIEDDDRPDSHNDSPRTSDPEYPSDSLPERP